MVLGYLVEGVPRAVGELKPIAGTLPPAAELAVSVEAPFRGRASAPSCAGGCWCGRATG